MKTTTVKIDKGSYVTFKVDDQTFRGDLQSPITLVLAQTTKAIVRSQANQERYWKISKRDQTFRALKLGERGVKKDQLFRGTQAQLREAYPGFRRAYNRVTA